LELAAQNNPEVREGARFFDAPADGRRAELSLIA
jgi:hypothetical protein